MLTKAKVLLSKIKGYRIYVFRYFYVLIAILSTYTIWGFYRKTIFPPDYWDLCLISVFFYTLTFGIYLLDGQRSPKNVSFNKKWALINGINKILKEYINKTSVRA